MAGRAVESKEHRRARYLASHDRILERQREHYAAHREQVREYQNNYHREGYKAAAYAKQLQRGEQIRNHANHHMGMAKLKEMLGDPRPEGLELSLVNWDSQFAYDGYQANNTEKPYRLSTNPADYAWETRAENTARRDSKWPDESVT